MGKGQETRAYAMKLVAGVLEHRDEFDEIFERVAEHWTVERMPVVDRNILRIGAYEMLYGENVPLRVVINEAVEMAKRFGGAESRRFVNAILDRVYRERPREREEEA